MDVSRGALFYGSPNVLLAIAQWKTESASNSSDRMAPIKAVGRIILAMRLDIGLSNRGLDELNIHQVYVKDDLRTFGKQK